MKVCFILPPLMLDAKVKRIMEQDFPKIQYTLLHYKENFEDVPALARFAQEQHDALLFGDIMTYECACRTVAQNKYWAYIPYSGSAMLCAIVNAIKAGWDVKRLSFDVYTDQILREVYEEIGYYDVGMKFMIFKGDPLSAHYTRDVVEYHKHNVRSQKADGCITSRSSAYRALKKAGIPALLALPTLNNIRGVLHTMQQVYLARGTAKGNISVLYISIGFPPDHSVVMESDWRFILEKMNITTQIYRSSYQLRGAVVEVSLRDYMLFTSQDIIELETRNYQNLALLDWASKESLYPLSIGIGHGETMDVAKKHAVLAMLRAHKHGQSAAYVLLRSERYLKITPGENAACIEERNAQLDAKFKVISDKTGLSVNGLYQLYCFMQEHPREGYLSQELAEGLGISRRSMDRVLQKLDQHGYVYVLGSHLLGKSGRPARILKINFGTDPAR